MKPVATVVSNRDLINTWALAVCLIMEGPG